MRHKIRMASNLTSSIGLSTKIKFENKKQRSFYKSFHSLHPKIQSLYDAESTSFNGLLEESRRNQIELIRGIEDTLCYNFETIEKVSPLDLKWSSLFSSSKGYKKNRMSFYLIY